MTKGPIDLPRMTTNFLLKIFVANIYRDHFEAIADSIATENRPFSVDFLKDWAWFSKSTANMSSLSISVDM